MITLCELLHMSMPDVMHMDVWSVYHWYTFAVMKAKKEQEDYKRTQAKLRR